MADGQYQTVVVSRAAKWSLPDALGLGFHVAKDIDAIIQRQVCLSSKLTSSLITLGKTCEEESNGADS